MFHLKGLQKILPELHIELFTIFNITKNCHLPVKIFGTLNYRVFRKRFPSPDIKYRQFSTKSGSEKFRFLN